MTSCIESNILDNFNNIIKKIKNNQNIQFYKVDISDNQEVVNLFSILKQSKHFLYGIINAAGVQSPIGEFVKNNMNDWKNNISKTLSVIYSISAK